MIRARNKARELRLQGLSVGAIAKITGASRGSVSVWVRDIELTQEQKQKLKDNQRKWAGQNAGAQTNRRRGQERRLTYQIAGREKAKEMNPLHMAGCLLYWAEGAKDRNTLSFVNSDPFMMQFFIRFLRGAMNVPASDILLYIHAHTDDPIELSRIKIYWTGLLELSIDAVKKTIFKKGSQVRHTVLMNGVCTIRVYGSELVQHIFGAIQEYGGFDNPHWLF